MNNNLRINASMTVIDAIIAMCEGNPGALDCMMQMMESYNEAMHDILLFDSLAVYGEKIYMLWNDCCSRDMSKFRKTIQAIRAGRISEEELHENLGRMKAKPFNI